MNQTVPKTFAFVLMPFSNNFEDVYKAGIKPACKDAGAYCERVDEQIFIESILERIFNQISKADVIISDMTGRNPNVFYETGYAHALGKQVILLTQNAEDIPFDLKHYPHIVYAGKISLLKEELERKVRWCIENPKDSLSRIETTLEFYMKGRPLTSKVKVSFPIGGDSQPKTLRFLLDIHNPSNKICDLSSIELGLILPREIARGVNLPTVILPDGRNMCILPLTGKMLPYSWKPIPVESFILGTESLSDKEFECAIRLYTEISVTDINFKLTT